MTLSPEEVGYWYFRINGFLTIQNFVVHPDDAGNQNTDADLIGVRFPYRAELLRDPMQDDDVFTSVEDKPFIVFVEIKKGQCNINRSLRDPAQQNINRLLRAVGVIPLELVDDVAEEIYATGSCITDEYHISFFCLGHAYNYGLEETYPQVPQVLWEQVFSFIFHRFERYRSLKANHPQWDATGKMLWNVAAHLRNLPEFVNYIERTWNISESV